MSAQHDSRVRPNGVVLAHPTGNQFFRHLATALRDSGRLASLLTCVDWRSAAWNRWLPRGVAAELGRRNFSRALQVPVATHPFREGARLAAGRLGLGVLTRHETGPFSVDAVYRDFDRWVARRLAREPAAGIAYAYEDAAEAIFTEAGRLGWLRAYDLPILYADSSRRLLEEEALRHPDWEPTLVGTRDSAQKTERKRRELELADVVVCPSNVVAASLPDDVRERKRVVVAPFGSPEPGPPPAPRTPGGPLRVLFAGSMTQRKGLADLFDAVRLLRRSDVELIVLGSLISDPEFYRRKGGSFTHEPPRPHAELLAFMRGCDLLCLPSIVEGRALVVQEAMSQGLPVLVTPQTGADDVVAEGISGFVVPMRDPRSIAEKLNWCADHRSALPGMGREARAAAAQWTWAGYGARVLAALDAIPSY